MWSCVFSLQSPQPDGFILLPELDTRRWHCICSAQFKPALLTAQPPSHAQSDCLSAVWSEIVLSRTNLDSRALKLLGGRDVTLPLWVAGRVMGRWKRARLCHGLRLSKKLDTAALLQSPRCGHRLWDDVASARWQRLYPGYTGSVFVFTMGGGRDTSTIFIYVNEADLENTLLLPQGWG